MEMIADQEHIRTERRKARELKKSQWWRSRLGSAQCYHCGRRLKPNEVTMDHLLPISRGGRSLKSNCVMSCKGCNTERGSSG